MPSRARSRASTALRGLVAQTGRTLAVLLLIAGSALASPPPYAADLERLAEILGSLQFLAVLCEEEPTDWRVQMEGLLAFTDPDADADWRARLTDRFNLGYSSFAAVYRNCTASARLAIAQYRETGAAIADAITLRYGDVTVDGP